MNYCPNCGHDLKQYESESYDEPVVPGKYCNNCGRWHKDWCGRCWEPIIQSATYWHVRHLNSLLKNGKHCWGDERLNHGPDEPTLAEYNPWGFRG